MNVWSVRILINFILTFILTEEERFEEKEIIAVTNSEWKNQAVKLAFSHRYRKGRGLEFYSASIFKFSSCLITAIVTSSCLFKNKNIVHLHKRKQRK